MSEILPKTRERQVLFFITLGLALLSAIVIWPFAVAVLSSLLFAYIFYPLYDKLNKKLRRPTLSALLISILIVLIVAVPVVFVLNAITVEATDVVINIRTVLRDEHIIENICLDNSMLCSTINDIQGVLEDSTIRSYVENSLQNTVYSLIDVVSNFLKSVPKYLLSGFVLLFVAFYVFKDGPKFVTEAWKVIHLKKKHQKKIEKKVQDVVRGVIFGHIVTAVIQGMVGAIGLIIFGIKSPVLWGVVMALVALLPFIGTALVWVPASIYLVGKGLLLSSWGYIGNGIGLFIYGIVVISTIDNFIRPKIIGSKGNIHPVVVLLGVIGGVNLFGLSGIFLGPVILSIFLTFLDIYVESRRN